MFDFDAIPGLCDREIAAIADRAKALSVSQWDRPIGWLPGWTVHDLVDHVARASGQQAIAIEHGLRGSEEQPAFPHPEARPTGAVLEALDAGRHRLVSALAKITPEDLGRMTPMPFAVVPTPVAATVAVIEYAYHRWDLERALDNDGYALPADIATHALEFMAGFIPAMAAGGRAPSQSMTLALTSPELDLRIGFDGTSWTPTNMVADTVADCTVRASASDLAMFTIGRIGADSTALTIEGDVEIAANLKVYAPGP
jgi:uncharacterized protein (TIGR03083 family)